MATSSTPAVPKKAKSIYEFTAKDIDQNDVCFEKYKGKVLMIVNVPMPNQWACHEHNFKQLKNVLDKYKAKGLEIAAFFCDQIKGTFQDSGSNKNVHPIYQYLKKEICGSVPDSIKLNFTNFLIDMNGKPFERYLPTKEGWEKMESDLEKLLPAFIIVKRSHEIDAVEERIELMIEQDNTLGLQTLIFSIHAFDGANGLKYKNPMTGEFRALSPDETGSKFRPPPGGWTGKEYVVIFQSSGPPAAAHQSNVPPIYIPIEVDELILQLENYLFYEEFEDIKRCFTIISPHYAISYNHGHHEKWRSSPDEDQTKVTICNQQGQKFETKVVECDAVVDFIVVKSDVQLVDNPPVIGLPRKLERYILMGYPNVDTNYQALEGVFSSIQRDAEGRMRGSSGCRRGYSGGPIFNYKGELLGINVAKDSVVKFMGIDGKSSVNELLDEINATFPFLSVIVPAYFLAAKYSKDCKFK